MVTLKQLKEISLFKAFSDAELVALAKLGTLETHVAFSNIVIEGELTWGLYVVLDGLVGVYKTKGLSEEGYDIAQLGKGAFFGEMSLLDDFPRSATVRAVRDTRVFKLNKDKFNLFLNQNPASKTRFYEYCVATLVRRLRELDDNYVVSQYQLWKTALSKPAEAPLVKKAEKKEAA